MNALRADFQNFHCMLIVLTCICAGEIVMMVEILLLKSLTKLLLQAKTPTIN